MSHCSMENCRFDNIVGLELFTCEIFSFIIEINLLYTFKYVL